MKGAMADFVPSVFGIQGDREGDCRSVTFGLSGKHYAGQNENSFEGHSL